MELTELVEVIIVLWQLFLIVVMGFGIPWTMLIFFWHWMDSGEFLYGEEFRQKFLKTLN